MRVINWLRNHPYIRDASIVTGGLLVGGGLLISALIYKGCHPTRDSERPLGIEQLVEPHPKPYSSIPSHNHQYQKR